MSSAARVTSALLVLLLPSRGSADSLHFFGPEGNPSERRVLAVLEGPGGACADPDTVRFHIEDPGVAISAGDRVGECARWLVLRADPPRDHVVVSADGPAASAIAALPMGADHGLTLHVARHGESLRVRVTGAPDAEDVRVTVFTDEATEPLERVSDRFEGTIPHGAVAGVVARSGGLVGAAISLPREPVSGPRAIVLPSALAVSAGGAARTAAFLIVLDRRGRPSRHVPLRISSERGSLRSLEWIEPGLAAIALSAGADDDTVDLSIDAGGYELASELPVAADWPVAAEVDAPAEVVAGESFVVDGSVRTLAGDEVGRRHVRVRCGDEWLPLVDGGVACVAPQAPAPIVVAIAAMVDDRAVPLASRAITVRAPDPPAIAAVPSEPVRSIASAADATDGGRSTLRVGVFAGGGLDTWSRTSVTGGAHLELSLGRVALGARLGYSITPFVAEPRSDGVVTERIAGARHDVALSVVAAWPIAMGAWSLVPRVGVGVSWFHDDATIGNTTIEQSGLAGVLHATVGPSLRILRSLDVEIAIGARYVPLQPADAFREAPVRFVAEVSGGVPL